jgi:2-polyprenyl-6-methoxyphenol hydroxylase-like FAD-dependent oxidoreductase
MNKLGYQVTVVEVAKGLETGGSPVDIKGGTVDIMKRTGLLERIQPGSLKAKAIDFLDAEGATIARMSSRPGDTQDAQPNAAGFGMDMFVPRTEDALRRRNEQMAAG